jgi:hypothetical protein
MSEENSEIKKDISSTEKDVIQPNTVVEPKAEAKVITAPEKQDVPEIKETDTKPVDDKKENSTEVSKDEKDYERKFVLDVCTGEQDDIKNAMLEVADKYKDPEFKKNPEGYPADLLDVIRSSCYTNFAEFLNELFNNKDNSSFKEIALKSTSGKRFGKDLKGEQAALAFTAKLKGLKKVYLYNSGFYIIIRPLTMGELSMFFQSVDMDDNDLGKLLGYYRFTIHDAFIKQKFMELLPTVIVSSNLKGWKNSSILLNSISFNDYDTLLWAMSTLVYRDPIELSLNCLKCKNKDTKTIDINKTFLLNNDVVSEAALEFIHSDKEEVTLEDIKDYKTNLLKASSELTHNDIHYKFSVPSMYDYLDNAINTIAVIVAAVNGENSVKNRMVINKTIIEFNRNYIPWIDEIGILENGELTTTSRDKKAFPSILDSLGNDDSNSEFHEKIYDFMRDSLGTLIGYKPYSCTNCGAEYKTKSGYAAWDVERLFFDLTYQLLTEIGLSLS